MNHGRTSRLLWTLLWGALCLGCASTSLQTPSTRRPYDRKASVLHPEVVLHRNMTSSSVDLYLSVNRAELLYSRASASSPFVAQLQIDLLDTSWTVVDTAWDQTPSLLRMRQTWQGRVVPAWAECEVMDLQRNTSWSTRRFLGPSDGIGARDVLAWSQHDKWAVRPDQATVNDTLRLMLPAELTQRSEGEAAWLLYHVTPPKSLPPPPYSGTRVRWDTLTPVNVGQVVADSMLVVQVAEGLTLFELASNELAIHVHGRQARFPELGPAPSLIAPVRYIATRAEHNKLKQANHPKLALDEFWLACGRTPNKARTLLQTYYDRVEEANHAFSGLVDGWKTDRGMVHVVFGIPQRIRRDAWNEYWVYGEEGTTNALTFHFRRKTTPYDDNNFVLQRSIQFRSAWDRAVSAWRNGRVRAN